LLIKRLIVQEERLFP